MELRRIKGLAKLIRASTLSEIEFNNGASSIRIVSAFVRTENDACRKSTPSRPAVESKGRSPQASTQGYVVRSPIVGISRTSAYPGQPPFVSIGTAVESGDTLGIVAALSTSRRISAETPGVIIDVLIEDGQPVEFDQPLFVIGSESSCAVDLS